MAGKQAASALALLLASLILISGCTSSKYNPCCVKSGLYDDTGAALPSPKCYFPNETFFGTCTLDAGVTGAANCTDGSKCGSIETADDCVKTVTCIWDEAAAPKCTGGEASWLLAVCQDLVPKSCVNDKCTAMICGYSSIRPSPPPASQDWDANKSAQDFAADPSKVSNAMPPNDMSLPAVNLQGATCDFNTMNKKLYNKMTSSRGGLWVNSFRFGVGSSFGDYEAARNYFPATDRVCAANPYATTDRFTVYLNTKDTYCKSNLPSRTYYACNLLSGVSFNDLATCKRYCGGGIAPYICAIATGTKYFCNSDGFAYANESACKQKCGIISDPNACTTSKSQFPFLNTDSSNQARYRLKYVSDYVVDTPSPQLPGTCNNLGEPDGSVSSHSWSWNSPPTSCNDFADWGDGPWFWSYNCSVADGGTCASGTDYLGELRTYFDNHAYSSVDFDYDYYVKNLYDQYQYSADANGKLPYECESGSECLSGSCDTTYYKRPMCKNVTDDTSIACGCTKVQDTATHTYYLSCNFNSPTPAYSDTGLYFAGDFGRPIASDPINSYSLLFTRAQSLHASDGTATSKFKYYFPTNYATAKPVLFDICGVAPTYHKMCIMPDEYCVNRNGESILTETMGDVIWYADGFRHGQLGAVRHLQDERRGAIHACHSPLR
ncbi:MAG: hypothetical protein NTX79_08180 [Candidatus Micrarchaeota archaeon]|nr:hypothetical protein [Candidatus Micrarchaeota archaeon]